MRYPLYIAILFVSLGDLQVAAQIADGSTRLATQYDDALRNNVKHLESQLEKQLKLLEKGFISGEEVDQNRASLAMLNHDLAVLEKDLDEVIKQRRLLTEVRERQWRRLQRLGQGHELQAIEAQRRFVVNRYLVAELEGRHDTALDELRHGIKLCEKEVEWWEEAAEKKLVARASLNWARNRLICARYQLSKSEARPEDLVFQLRDSVETLKNDWSDVKELSERRLVSFVDEYFAHTYLLDAQLRLANLESKPDALQQLLRQQLKLHGEALTRGRKAGWGMQYPVSFQQDLEHAIATALNRDTQRLNDLLRTGELNDDLTIASLDP